MTNGLLAIGEAPKQLLVASGPDPDTSRISNELASWILTSLYKTKQLNIIFSWYKRKKSDDLHPTLFDNIFSKSTKILW
jgi:hypothetical protein